MVATRREFMSTRCELVIELDKESGTNSEAAEGQDIQSGTDVWRASDLIIFVLRNPDPHEKPFG